MNEYSMPEVPDNDLVDKDGQRWTKVSGMWWRVPRNKNNAFVQDGYCSWLDLVSRYGPLEDFVQKYNVVYQKNNGLVSSPGDTSIYERDLTKDQAQRMINSFLGITPLSLVLKFERGVMLKRNHDGYVYTYSIEEA